MKKLTITFRYGVADKNVAKDNYYRFWLWQYLRRNQEYNDAWALSNNPELNRLPTDAARLLRQYMYMMPDVDLHKDGDFWLIDEVNNVGFHADGPLTSGKILETLLAVHSKQGGDGRKDVKCNYVLPRISCFYHTGRIAEPNLKDISDDDLDDAVRKVKIIRQIDKEDPPVENAWLSVGKDRRVKSWNINRAIGLWLYDERMQRKKSIDAVVKFHRKYKNDDRLPASKRAWKWHKNLYTLLRLTKECIEKREVLPFKL